MPAAPEVSGFVVAPTSVAPVPVVPLCPAVPVVVWPPVVDVADPPFVPSRVIVVCARALDASIVAASARINFIAYLPWPGRPRRQRPNRARVPTADSRLEMSATGRNGRAGGPRNRHDLEFLVG